MPPKRRTKTAKQGNKAAKNRTVAPKPRIIKTPKPPAPPEVSRFLKLPQELRDMVYGFVIPDEFEPESRDPAHKAVFALLSLNHQIRAEASMALRTFKTTFSVRVDQIGRFLDAIGKPGRKGIVSLKLRDFVWIPWYSHGAEQEHFRNPDHDSATPSRRMFDAFDKHRFPGPEYNVKHLTVEVRKFFRDSPRHPNYKTPVGALCNENHPNNLTRFGRYDTFEFVWSREDLANPNITHMLTYTQQWYKNRMIKDGKKRTW